MKNEEIKTQYKNEVMKVYYKNIKKYISTNILNNTYKNINDFINQNKSLQDFLSNSEFGITASHQFKIDENDYKQILEILSKELTSQKETYETKQQETKQQETRQKVKIRKATDKKVSGFIDILIIAILTGSFIGVILLNIYSKIVQNI